MPNEAAHDNGVAEKAHGSSSTVIEEELKHIRDAASSLPANAVKDLVSAEVCYQCIFRVFGLQELICSHPSLSTSVLSAIVQGVLELGGDEVDNISARKHENSNGQQCSQVCSVCSGILQFLYLDDKMLVRKECASDFAATIAEAVKREHQQIDSFSLEVSLPRLVTEKENALWLYMKNKYSTELWYQELSIQEHVCTKDVLKMWITDTLESILGVKSNMSSFHIRLTYADATKMDQDLKVNNGFNKRSKTGSSEDVVINQGSVIASVESTDIHEGETNVLVKTSEFQVHGVDSLKLHLEKVCQPCCLTRMCYRSPIYVGGRYLKYSRNVSQTRWIIDDERIGEASVEEIIGSNILPICGGDTYKFHAAGREDIDVRMLGTGRPFLIEVQNARQVPSEELIKDIELKINSLESKLVKVKNLKSLGNQGWALMREGEAEKQKQYAALVWISRPIDDNDLQTISSLKDMKILQKTPVRVLHRRSPLEREKIIHWMKIERIAGSAQYFLLHLCTQAGTYIKEFVHGDLGRTNPSAEQKYFNLMSQMSKWIASRMNEAVLSGEGCMFYPACNIYPQPARPDI